MPLLLMCCWGFFSSCVVWCNNLSLILCGTDLGQLEVWDGDKATLVSAVKGHSGTTCIAF